MVAAYGDDRADIAFSQGEYRFGIFLVGIEDALELVVAQQADKTVFVLVRTLGVRLDQLDEIFALGDLFR